MNTSDMQRVDPTHVLEKLDRISNINKKSSARVLYDKYGNKTFYCTITITVGRGSYTTEGLSDQGKGRARSIASAHALRILQQNGYDEVEFIFKWEGNERTLQRYSGGRNPVSNLEHPPKFNVPSHLRKSNNKTEQVTESRSVSSHGPESTKLVSQARSHVVAPSSSSGSSKWKRVTPPEKGPSKLALKMRRKRERRQIENKKQEDLSSISVELEEHDDDELEPAAKRTKFTDISNGGTINEEGQTENNDPFQWKWSHDGSQTWTRFPLHNEASLEHQWIIRSTHPECFLKYNDSIVEADLKNMIVHLDVGQCAMQRLTASDWDVFQNSIDKERKEREKKLRDLAKKSTSFSRDTRSLRIVTGVNNSRIVNPCDAPTVDVQKSDDVLRVPRMVELEIVEQAAVPVTSAKSVHIHKEKENTKDADSIQENHGGGDGENGSSLQIITESRNTGIMPVPSMESLQRTFPKREEVNRAARIRIQAPNYEDVDDLEGGSPFFNVGTPGPLANMILNPTNSHLSLFMDSHTHLDFIRDRIKFNNFIEFKERVPEAFVSNFGGCIANFIRPSNWSTYDKLITTLCKEKLVRGTTWGIHPHEVDHSGEDIIQCLKRILKNKKNEYKICGVGESGIDTTGSRKPFNLRMYNEQLRIFKIHWNLSIDHDLALVVHCRQNWKWSERNAEDDILRILSKRPNLRIHRHCFCGSVSTARRWIDALPNCYFGFTTKALKDERFEDLLNEIPFNRLLIESDAPYHPSDEYTSFNFKSDYPHRYGNDDWSTPQTCYVVANAISRLLNKSLDDVIRRTFDNTRTCYGI